MLSRLVLLAAVFAASVASAAAPVKITVYKLEAGYYCIQNGEIVAFPPGGPVVPPDDPIVPPVSEFSKAVTDAVAKIPASDKRHEQAMKMTAVLQLVGTKVGDGTLPFANAGQMVNLLAKAALGNANSELLQAMLELDANSIIKLLERMGGAYNDWSLVISVIEAELSKQSTKTASAQVLDAAAVSVLSTVPSSEEAVSAMRANGPLKDNAAFQKLATLYKFDWDTFLAFLMQLLQALLPLIISASKIAIGILIA